MYGSVNVPGAAATVERGGAMSAADKLSLETLKSLVPFTLMERTRSGNPIIFPDGAAANAKDLRVTLTPSQSGSGDPSPDNVRPISGATSVSVKRSGKNLLEITESSTTINGITFTVNRDAGTINANGSPTGSNVTWFTAGTATLLPDDYILSGGAHANCMVQLEFGGNAIQNNGNGGTAFTVHSATTGNVYIRAQGSQPNRTAYPMIRYASDTDATFTPYAGAQSVTVPLVDSNSDPLAVYGGTLDVTTGELSVTHVHLHLTGSTSENWTVTQTQGGLAWFYMKNIAPFPVRSGTQYATGPFYCSQYTPYYNGQLWTKAITGVIMQLYPDIYQICFADTRYPAGSTLDVWIERLADSPVDVVYPLATPVAYQLTPQQLAALAGYNAVYADAETLSVTYRADPSISVPSLGGA